MHIIEKEMMRRKSEIEKELDLLFKANMKITDWDVPEADDDLAARLLLDILQTKLDQIKQEVSAGKYNDY